MAARSIPESGLEMGSGVDERRRTADGTRHAARAWIMAGAAVASLAVAAGWKVQGGRVHSASTGGVETASPPSPSSLGAVRAGDRVTRRARLKLAFAPPGRSPAQELDVAGDLTTTVAGWKDGVASVLFELSGVDVHMRGGAAAEGSGVDPYTLRAERELGQKLSHRFFVDSRASGAVTSVALAKNENPAVGNIFMALAAATQFVRGSAGEVAWITSERDANGQYTATYQRMAPDRFHKQKAAYLRASAPTAVAAPSAATNPASPGAPVIHIERSTADFRLDSADRVLEEHTDEVVVLNLAGFAVRLTLTVDLTDARVGSAPESADALAGARAAMQALPLSQLALDSTADLARRDRLLLQGATFDDLVRKLKDLRSDDVSNPDVSAARQGFEALFRSDSGAAKRAPALVEKEKPERGKWIVDALSLAGTPASVSAITQIASDGDAPLLPRKYAIQYVARAEKLDRDDISRVAGLLDTPDSAIRQMARLAYGACARRSPAEASGIVRELVSRARRSTGEEDESDFVMALGNTGSPEALPALREWIDESNTTLRVRTQAIEALRFIEDPSVNGILSSALHATEPDPVRLAALAAIRYRNAGPFTLALAEMTKKDPSDGVRHAAIDLVGSRLSDFPALRSVLADAMAHDRAAENRRLAAGFLGRPAEDSASL